MTEQLNNERNYKVVCIVGKGLSGTTLFSHILGAHSSTINVGEINNLRKMALHHSGKACSDGVAFDQHPFWQEVLARLEQGGYQKPPELRAKEKRDFIRGNDLVYEALHAASNGKVIIESCKNTGRVRRLHRYFKSELYFIHLVKDPRSYALSYKKRGRSELKVISKLFNWNLKETYYYLWMRMAGLRFIDVHYEALAHSPAEEIARVMSFIGLPPESRQMEYYSVPQPVFWGNRMMLNEKAEIKLRPDYLKKISPLKWFLYTLISLPGSLLNNYPLRKKLPAFIR